MFQSSFRGASLPLALTGLGLGLALMGCGGGGGTNLPAPGSGQGDLGTSGGGGTGGTQVDANTIVFVSTRDGNPEIYSMKSNGTGAKRLTNNAAIDQQPSRSTDGSSIVFSSLRDGNAEIYKMNADGSGLLRLTRDDPTIPDAPTDTNPVFSPDGSKIVWQSTRAAVSGGQPVRRLYIMDSTGANQRPVAFADINQRSLEGSWNPDNTRLLGVTDNSQVSGATDLAVISPGNGTQTPATANVLRTAVTFLHPRYSPAGARIVVANTPVAAQGRLQLLNSDGSLIGDGPTGGVGQANPSFNPAGTRLAWDAPAATGQNRQIYVSDVAGTGTQPAGVAITSQGENYQPSWTQ